MNSISAIAFAASGCAVANAGFAIFCYHRLQAVISSREAWIRDGLALHRQVDVLRSEMETWRSAFRGACLQLSRATDERIFLKNSLRGVTASRDAALGREVALALQIKRADQPRAADGKFAATAKL